MEIVATTDHGGLQLTRNLRADNLREFARELENGKCGPVYKSAGTTEHLVPVWDELRVFGKSRYAFTVFTRKPVR